MFENGNTYYFTGVLTGGRRDTHTLSPKTLMLNIMSEGNEFRDHCWLHPCKRIVNFIPKSHEKDKTRIAFSARVEEYLSSHGKKQGLRHIRNVMVILENKC